MKGSVFKIENLVYHLLYDILSILVIYGNIKISWKC